MAVLNLTLKKDIFDGLMNRTDNQIPIDKTNWWKKRLIDQDTGRFKEFETASVCSGSADKYVFPIEKIEDKGSRFIVTVVFPKEEVKEETIEIIDESIEIEVPEVDEVDETPVAPIVFNEEKPIIKVGNVAGKTEQPKEQQVKKEKQPTLEEKLNALMTKLSSHKNIYFVPTDSAVVRKNGRIVGSNKTIKMNGDYDEKLQFDDKEFVIYNDVSDEAVINYVSKTITSLSTINYVFIKSGSNHIVKGINGGCDKFVIKLTYKKIYLFGR